MSYASVQTATVAGVEVIPISVEVDLRPGLPQFRIIGLPDKQIEEAKERVRSAIKNSGLEFPLSRLTVNLSPSDLPKVGTGFDLAIALAILSAQQKRQLVPPNCWVLGELGLNGLLLPFQRLVAILVGAQTRVSRCVVPQLEDQPQLANLKLLQAHSLRDVLPQLYQQKSFTVYQKVDITTKAIDMYSVDQIVGQLAAKRALMIGLAGGHNILFTGPPGAGKTLLAAAAVQLLPDLDEQAQLDLLALRSLSGQSRISSARPPVQAPHHTVSLSGMLGGGAELLPGAMTLAHRGILFLDEFPEFRRDVREALRQPLQEREIHIFRNGRRYVFPADCLVLAAQNECPCGLFGTPQCRCTMAELLHYQKKISQPLRDRFSLFVDVPKLPSTAWQEPPAELRGNQMAEGIIQARLAQRERSQGHLNGRLSLSMLRSAVRLSPAMQDLLERAQSNYLLSMRGLHALLSVSRTIADLAGEREVTLAHLTEALQYRQPFKT